MKFLPTLISFVLCCSVLSPAATKESSLVLRGKVVNIQLERGDGHYVDCKLTLSIEFINTGSKPIIVLQPHEPIVAETYWQGGVSIALTKEDVESHRFVFNSQYWPSVNTGTAFNRFAKELDQPNPPAELTRIIGPNETWIWNTTTQFRFSQKTDSNGLQEQWGWSEISQVKSPLWLKLYYGIWSLNLERADNGLIKRLRKRWQNFGVLWPDGDPADRDMITEPMLLKFNEAKSPG